MARMKPNLKKSTMFRGSVPTVGKCKKKKKYKVRRYNGSGRRVY